MSRLKFYEKSLQSCSRGDYAKAALLLLISGESFPGAAWPLVGADLFLAEPNRGFNRASEFLFIGESGDATIALHLLP